MGVKVKTRYDMHIHIMLELQCMYDNLLKMHSICWELGVSIHMESWPKVELYNVVSQLSKPLACPIESHIWLLLAPIQMKSWLKVISSWNQFEHCSKITRLASRKSYLLIIVPNWHEQLTKSVIRSNCSWFEHCSKSLNYPLGNRIWSILAPILMKGWSKVSSSWSQFEHCSKSLV